MRFYTLLSSINNVYIHKNKQRVCLAMCLARTFRVMLTRNKSHATTHKKTQPLRYYTLSIRTNFGWVYSNSPTHKDYPNKQTLNPFIDSAIYIFSFTLAPRTSKSYISIHRTTHNPPIYQRGVRTSCRARHRIATQSNAWPRTDGPEVDQLAYNVKSLWWDIKSCCIVYINCI